MKENVCPGCSFKGTDEAFIVSIHQNPNWPMNIGRIYMTDVGFECPECGTKFGFECGRIERHLKKKEAK